MTMHTDALEVMGYAEGVAERVAEQDWIGALCRMNLLAENFMALAADVAQAAHDAGHTKKRIALALNVPPSTFRGMERRVTT